MNRVESFLLKLAVVMVGIGFLSTAVFADPDPTAAPFSQDENSGKTVMSHEEGYGIILSRFYNAPVRGSEAPELTLHDPESGDEVELGELIDVKPVVLLFGSLGCDTLYEAGDAIKQCIDRFGGEIDFVLVYVREAHSLEAQENSAVVLDTPVISDPKTVVERAAAAARFLEEKNLDLRVLIDSLDDRGATRWAGWPVRVFAIDQERTVVYAGKPGPWGFFPTPEVKDPNLDRMRAHEDRFNQESLYEFLESYLQEES